MDTRINNNHNHSRPTISIKCLQINCRRAYAPFKETMNYILQNNIDIAFVSEPYLINDHRPATINPITCFHHHNIQTDDLANLETVLRNKDLVEDWTSYVRLIMDGLAHINREP